MERIFSELVNNRLWGSHETPCGPGSTFESCKPIIDRLPKWIRDHGIRKIADLGCGDWNWMKHIDLSTVEYDGYDVVESLILKNIELYSKDSIRFHKADLLDVQIPKVDLVILKDVLVHLVNHISERILQKVKESKSRLLAATTGISFANEHRLIKEIGGFAPINMEEILGAPIDTIEVPSRKGNPKKYFSLWRLNP
jgi:hypothetical protein